MACTACALGLPGGCEAPWEGEPVLRLDALLLLADVVEAPPVTPVLLIARDMLGRGVDGDEGGLLEFAEREPPELEGLLARCRPSNPAVEASMAAAEAAAAATAAASTSGELAEADDDSCTGAAELALEAAEAAARDSSTFGDKPARAFKGGD